MSEPDVEAVRAALSKIIDPAQGKDIVSTGQVQGLGVNGERASFILEVDPNRGSAMEPLRKAAEAAAKSVPGIVAVNVVMTAHSGEGQAQPAQPAPQGRSPGFPIKAPKPLPGASKRVPGVDRIIAVASGKGGVGKSTVSANLAVALAAQGKRVGLLDADVYGPSQPRMLGVSGRPSSPDGHIILPLRNHGVTLMSIGLMTGEDEAVVWRGPMLMGALQQMLTQVQWGRLDVLLVDLPPGTGDVQMTLCQKAEVDGVVIVSTPQDIALIDARKGIDMFQKMNTPILGIIENMSSFICSTCETVHHPFGHGGARAEAEKLGVPFLGEIPLDLDIRIASDGGAPIVATKPDSLQTRAFWNVADKLMKSDPMQ
jgi:ATP-binding protein involved in chromosome partitioning